VHPEDIRVFFSFMQDKDSLWKAAFTPKEPHNLVTHVEHWNKILNNPAILNRTILVDGVVVGNIGRYFMDEIAQLTYWISADYKNQGIATAAVKEFLLLDPQRPMEARTAFDNLASAKVLEKNGFLVWGADTYFANARNAEIVETIWRLV
jgi:RimJ/RimL family protein N-acetyltransferase